MFSSACGTAEPYCPIRSTCSLVGGEMICEFNPGADEFCHVFELGGVVTDDCSAVTWCDDTLDPPACRPMRHGGDPCDEGRQCSGLACDAVAGSCVPEPDWWDVAQGELETWCPGLLAADETG